MTRRGAPAAALLAAALLTSASPAQIPAPAVPQSDFERLCSGHITAVPREDGTPGPHLEWTAYSSPTPVEELARRHAQELHAGAHEQDRDGCHLWRFADGARSIWDLCPVEVQGPASQCAAPPKGTKSILLVSVMIGGASKPLPD